jgi:hypothetical protein
LREKKIPDETWVFQYELEEKNIISSGIVQNIQD